MILKMVLANPLRSSDGWMCYLRRERQIRS
jgi:hypothetical protein